MLLKLALLIVIAIVLVVLVRGEQTDLTNLPEIKVYASFTSIPPRLNKTEKIIKNLLKQTYPIERIIFNIPNGVFRTGEKYFIPKFLEKYKDKVTVVRCQEYGPATKILGGLDYIPDDAFVYVRDDDMDYPKNHLERLVSQLKDDTDVVSNTLCYYNTGINNSGICGYSGYIVKRNILNDLHAYFDKLPEECLYVDDVWVSNYLQEKKAKIEFGDLLDNLEVATKARIKDLVFKDKTSLFNTVNKGNVNILSNDSKNKICEKKLRSMKENMQGVY